MIQNKLIDNSWNSAIHKKITNMSKAKCISEKLCKHTFEEKKCILMGFFFSEIGQKRDTQNVKRMRYIEM